MRFLSTALLFIALLVGFSAMVPEPAQAQRCPPGIPGQGNPSCIPPDILFGNQNGDQQAPQQAEAPLLVKWQAGHSALVWHPDATEVWAVWDADSVEDATYMAMKACNKVMGKDCAVAQASTGGTIVFGPGSDGYLRAAWGNKKKGAIKQFHKNCADAGISCRVQETITSTHIQRPAMVPILRTKSHLPDTRGAAAYGAVASPKPDPVGTKWQGQVWLVTGQPTYAAATDKAVAACAAATGLKCEVDTHGVNSNIYLYTTQDDMFFWSVGLSRKEAEADMARKCKQRFKGKKCVIAGFYDMQTPRNEMVAMQWNP